MKYLFISLFSIISFGSIGQTMRIFGGNKLIKRDTNYYYGLNLWNVLDTSMYDVSYKLLYVSARKEKRDSLAKHLYHRKPLTKKDSFDIALFARVSPYYRWLWDEIKKKSKSSRTPSQ